MKTPSFLNSCASSSNNRTLVAVSPTCSRQGVRRFDARGKFLHSAECNSAIQQNIILRYKIQPFTRQPSTRGQCADAPLTRLLQIILDNWNLREIMQPLAGRDATVGAVRRLRKPAVAALGCTPFTRLRHERWR